MQAPEGVVRDPGYEPEDELRARASESAWRTIGRIAAAFVVVLAGGEVLTRLTIGGPSPQEYDPQIGYVYRPYSEQFQAKEGKARFQYNALGLNDEDIADKSGRCRVLVIGDSYTAALQVPRASNFTSVAERIDPHLDVVNGGRDGLFLGDMHKAQRRVFGAVKPDLTVFVISQRAVETDITLPEFSVGVDPVSGRVVDATMQVEQRELLRQAFAPLVRESALATRFAAQAKPLVVDALAQVNQWRAKLASVEPEVPAPNATATTVHRPASEDVLEFVFRRFAGAGPAALLYLNGLNYTRDGAIVGPTSLRAQVQAQEAAERAGVAFFDTGKELIAAEAATGQPPFGFDNALRPGGHLNEMGHDAVAQALVGLVRSMGSSVPAECRAP